MKSPRLLSAANLCLASALLAWGAAGAAAQVAVAVIPAGVSISVAAGAAVPSNRAMVLPSADFARNLSFQMDRLGSASLGTVPQAIGVQLQRALQAQVSAGVPQSRAVATQNVLVAALTDPGVRAVIEESLRRTAAPENSALGREAARKLAGLAAAAAQSPRARSELHRCAGPLSRALAASLAGDSREFARLFDGLRSRADLAAPEPAVAADAGASGPKIRRPLLPAKAPAPAPLADRRRDMLVKLGRRRGLTLEAVQETLERRGAFKDLVGLNDEEFASAAGAVLRRDDLERAVAGYPAGSAQGRFMRVLAGNAATPSGQSLAEISAEGAFAYVNFSGGAVVGEPRSGRERNVPAQVIFSVSRAGGRWRVSVFHRGDLNGRPDADYVRFFKNWLVSGGIPASDLE
jgi:hypothetical protein